MGVFFFCSVGFYFLRVVGECVFFDVFKYYYCNYVDRQCNKFILNIDYDLS